MTVDVAVMEEGGSRYYIRVSIPGYGSVESSQFIYSDSLATLMLGAYKLPVHSFYTRDTVCKFIKLATL